MYSTFGARAWRSGFGFVVCRSWIDTIRISPPISTTTTTSSAVRARGRKDSGVTPGAVPSITPGPHVYTTTWLYSGLHSDTSDDLHTSSSAAMYLQAPAPYSVYSYHPPTPLQTASLSKLRRGGSTPDIGGCDVENERFQHQRINLGRTDQIRLLFWVDPRCREPCS